MDISIIIPTRHRPQNIDRIIAETKGSLGRQFEMVLGIDEDDENQIDMDAISPHMRELYE